MTQNDEVKKLDEVLSEKLDQFFPKENSAKEEASEEVEENQEIESEEEVEKPESEQSEEPDSEAQDDDVEQDPEFEEEKELDRQLSGQPKEFKDLVKSVKDPDVRARILEAGKVYRAREDKVRLELGNTKKELGNVSGLLKYLDTNPAEAIKHIAKVTKVDLSTLVKPVVEDDEDYRTPEEKARDKKIEDIEAWKNAQENQQLTQAKESTAQQIKNFESEKDSDGNLKHPHFERVRKNMAPFFDEKSSLFDPEMTMEKAYKKAVLLDDGLLSEREAEILRKANDKRKVEIEKAKKLKKFSGRSANVNVKPASARAGLENIVDNWMAGS